MSSLLRQSAGAFSVLESRLEELLAQQMVRQTGQSPSLKAGALDQRPLCRRKKR